MPIASHADTALLGTTVWAATGMLVQPVRLMVAGDGFFGVYLVLMALLATRATPEDMRRRASFEDEGIILIVLITLTAICLSIGSIFALLNETEQPDTLRLALAIASVPLGWLTLHTIAAFHYAHLYYAKAMSSRGQRQDASGLEFPETSEPTGWDFLYYSFVVGMTAQVSDVQVLTTPMRQLTLAHGVVSFFYNTVILALAVNVAVGQGTDCFPFARRPFRVAIGRVNECRDLGDLTARRSPSASR